MTHPATQHTHSFTLDSCEAGDHACYGIMLVATKSDVIGKRLFGKEVFFSTPGDAQNVAIPLANTDDPTILALGVTGGSIALN